MIFFWFLIKYEICKGLLICVLWGRYFEKMEVFIDNDKLKINCNLMLGMRNWNNLFVLNLYLENDKRVVINI